MPESNLKTECDRCGTCCIKGGPALHIEDMGKLHKDITRKSLITIRKGEPVFFPDKVEPGWNINEIVKFKGKSSQWTCIFYKESNSSCKIYRQRPLECVLFKCWDSDALDKVVGRNMLNRLDFISADEPVIPYIKRHEKNCSLELLSGQLDFKQTGNISNDLLAELNRLVNNDLDIRFEAVAELELNIDLELFYFGRPLFKILSQFNLLPREVHGRVILSQN